MWVLGMVVGQFMGWLVLSDWVDLFSTTVLLQDGLSIALWLVWSIVAAASIVSNGASMKRAASLGLSLGSFGGALVLEYSEKDGEPSRFVMTTLAASLLHPGTMIGGLYFFAETKLWILLWVLAVLFYSKDGPEGLVKSQEQPEASTKWLAFGGVTLATSFLLTTWSVEILLGTLPIWIWKSRQNFPWRSLVYVAGVFACVNLAVASGLPEMAAWGLEELPMDVHFVLPTAILVASALLSALIGAIPMAFFGVALFERLMDLPSIGLSTGPLLALYGVGLVAGNIRPMIWAKTVRPNIFHWFISSFVFINVLAVVVYKTF